MHETILKILRGIATPEEEERVRGWLHESEENRLIYNELSKVYFRLSASWKWNAVDLERAKRRMAGKWRKKRTLGRSWKVGLAGAVAAGMLMLLGIRIALRPGLPAEVPQVVGESLVGPGMKKAQLKLADGSMVDVAGDSMRIEEKGGAKIRYADGTLSYSSRETMKKTVYNELIVPVAGECYVVLDDGTRVWVNSASRLKYPLQFAGPERKVYLEGEAFFEVAKNEKPFMVHTSRGEVRVRGTSFDIKAYAGEPMLTTLVTGKVTVCHSTEMLDLLPGEQAIVAGNGTLQKQRVDPMEYIGWREGLYVFRDQRLETIMGDLCRWYGISVFYQNPDMKEIRFTGNLKRYDNINTFMDILKRTRDVKCNIDGNTIILYQ